MKKEVNDDQVGHVDRSAGEIPWLEPHTPERHAVAGQAAYEDKAVGDLVVGEAVTGVHSTVERRLNGSRIVYHVELLEYSDYISQWALFHAETFSVEEQQ